MNKRLLTLCFVHDHPRVLLGMKKCRFGAGLWNGFGGKVEEGEEVEEAAIRELKEESGLDAPSISKRGILTFEFENDPAVLEVHVFYTDKFQGEIIETDEMRPQWFHIDEIPYSDMWTDDKFWIPMLLEGKKFKGTFLFDRPSDKNYHAKIMKQELVEVEEI